MLLHLCDVQGMRNYRLNLWYRKMQIRASENRRPLIIFVVMLDITNVI